MKKIFTIFFVILITLTYSKVGAFSGETATIGELKTNIKNLSKKQEEVKHSWENFLKNNGGIKIFLRKDLKKQEIDKILNLAKSSNYSNSKKQRIEFYKKLYPYIDLRYKNAFFDFIKKEVKKIELDNNISREVKNKKEILKKQVKKYEKVAEKKEKYYFGVVIKNTIRKKIQSKLSQIEAKKSFQNLSIKKRIFLYKTFIKKINIKIQKLESLENGENKKLKRTIMILEILKEELLEKISVFENQL